MTGEEIALAILKSGSSVPKDIARQLAQEHLDLLSQTEWKNAMTEPPAESGYYPTTYKFMNGYARAENAYYDVRTNRWNHKVELWFPFPMPPKEE